MPFDDEANAPPTAVALRATIDQLLGHRTRALALFEQAFDTLQEARAEAAKAAPSRGYFNFERGDLEDLGGSIGTHRDDFLKACRAKTDREVWEHLLAYMGLEKLMDTKAREEFKEALRKDPPEVTAENCAATFGALVEDAPLIFRRGIANVFSKLDRRFRSHDGFKIGARIVINNALSSYGSWERDSTLRDIERTFCILDGKEQPDWNGGICGMISHAKRGGSLDLQPGLVENEHFKVRWFKNGNVHMWFLRDDLVLEVNRLLAEYYGATLGEGSDVAEQRVDPKRTPAKNYAFFETPEKLAAELADDAMIEPGMRVLEPSAGMGRIARACRAKGAKVDCIEVWPDRARHLREMGYATDCVDFLDVTPRPIFDRIVMNPPFDGGRDIDHVMHALGFLKPGGILIAVMSAGSEFREDRRATQFRDKVKSLGGSFRDLPPGSFAESGTNVNTIKLAIGRSRYW